MEKNPIKSEMRETERNSTSWLPTDCILTINVGSVEISCRRGQAKMANGKITIEPNLRTCNDWKKNFSYDQDDIQLCSTFRRRGQSDWHVWSGNYIAFCQIKSWNIYRTNLFRFHANFMSTFLHGAIFLDIESSGRVAQQRLCWIVCQRRRHCPERWCNDLRYSMRQCICIYL